MKYNIICAGFGGQGVLTAGMVIAGIGSLLNKHVTWFPSYGSEMRGGTANCNVVVSDTQIASPFVREPNILLAMNEPALDKFEQTVVPGGYVFVNADVVSPDREYRSDIHVIKVDAVKLAHEINNTKGSNIIMLGAITKATGMFQYDECEQSMCKYFADKGKEKFNDANRLALKTGYDSVNV